MPYDQKSLNDQKTYAKQLRQLFCKNIIQFYKKVNFKV